jgi:predicted amidohydrolase
MDAMRRCVARGRPHLRERTVLAAGQGTKVFEVGGSRIGCLICADGSQTAAWGTFKHDRPDLIFWQNNQGSVADEKPNLYAKLRVPPVAGNRGLLSYKVLFVAGVRLAFGYCRPR